jgi:hypothetical protein
MAIRLTCHESILRDQMRIVSPGFLWKTLITRTRFHDLIGVGSTLPTNVLKKEARRCVFEDSTRPDTLPRRNEPNFQLRRNEPNFGRDGTNPISSYDGTNPILNAGNIMCSDLRNMDLLVI